MVLMEQFMSGMVYLNTFVNPCQKHFSKKIPNNMKTTVPVMITYLLFGSINHTLDINMNNE